MTGWLLLPLAIGLELVGTVCLKLSDGFTRLAPAVAMGACYLGSFGLLGLIVQRLPLGLTYAIWAGLGTALMALAGIVFFREPASALKAGGIACIVVGIVVLNLHGAR